MPIKPDNEKPFVHNYSEREDDWALAIGRALLHYSEIEWEIATTLYNFLRDDVYQDLPRDISKRANIIRKILIDRGWDKNDPSLLDDFKALMNRVLRLKNTRDKIAHNPAAMHIYNRKRVEPPEGAALAESFMVVDAIKPFVAHQRVEHRDDEHAQQAVTLENLETFVKEIAKVEQDVHWVRMRLHAARSPTPDLTDASDDDTDAENGDDNNPFFIDGTHPFGDDLKRSSAGEGIGGGRNGNKSK